MSPEGGDSSSICSSMSYRGKGAVPIKNRTCCPGPRMESDCLLISSLETSKFWDVQSKIPHEGFLLDNTKKPGK